MSRSEETRYPFAKEGGLARAEISGRDPFEVLDDLMAFIEQLCPLWPARGTFADSTRMLL